MRSLVHIGMSNHYVKIMLVDRSTPVGARTTQGHIYETRDLPNKRVTWALTGEYQIGFSILGLIRNSRYLTLTFGMESTSTTTCLLGTSR